MKNLLLILISLLSLTFASCEKEEDPAPQAQSQPNMVNNNDDVIIVTDTAVSDTPVIVTEAVVMDDTLFLLKKEDYIGYLYSYGLERDDPRYETNGTHMVVEPFYETEFSILNNDVLPGGVTYRNDGDIFVESPTVTHLYSIVPGRNLDVDPDDFYFNDRLHTDRPDIIFEAMHSSGAPSIRTWKLTNTEPYIEVYEIRYTLTNDLSVEYTSKLTVCNYHYRDDYENQIPLPELY